MVRLRVPIWKQSLQAKPFSCHWVRASGRVKETDTSPSLSLRSYLGNGLFGHIHACAFADTALHSDHALLATGKTHAADSGNDALHAGSRHVGDVVC